MHFPYRRRQHAFPPNDSVHMVSSYWRLIRANLSAPVALALHSCPVSPPHNSLPRSSSALPCAALLPQRMTSARAEKLQDELVTIERERSRKEPEVEAVSQQGWLPVIADIRVMIAASPGNDGMTALRAAGKQAPCQQA